MLKMNFRVKERFVSNRCIKVKGNVYARIPIKSCIYRIVLNALINQKVFSGWADGYLKNLLNNKAQQTEVFLTTCCVIEKNACIRHRTQKEKRTQSYGNIQNKKQKIQGMKTCSWRYGSSVQLRRSDCCWLILFTKKK